MITALTPREYQQLLIDHGYDLGPYGADGAWGGKTSTASEAWFARGENLAAADTPRPAPGQVVPEEWLPDCKMLRIVGHWTAGSYMVSEEDLEHYHIIVGGSLKLYRGDVSIKANVSTSDADGYAAHTRGCNSGSIGISVACMANAREGPPFVAGTYPMTEPQWLMLAAVAADCCRAYKIKVTPQTVLTHGEVEATLGIKQLGKWDICVLPWNPNLSSVQVNDLWRREVAARL